ncbi:MAG: molybdenum cofactor guanylyltransferase [Deltaproteobacteria bacterium]|nr:molybdenum cofactor guanylyltransferase [Deltaproteobacteria bacterium]
MPFRFIGIALVGGKSSRMGQNKALLKLPSGISLADKALEVLKGVKIPAEIEACYLSGGLEGYPSIPDIVLDKGPLGGIYSCISALSSGEENLVFVFIPVDMPAITPALLEQLLFSLTPRSLVSHFSGEQFPVAIRVTKAVINLLEKRLLDCLERNFSVKAFLADLEILEAGSVVKVDKASVDMNFYGNFFNANTPNEWQYFLKESSHEC